MRKLIPLLMLAGLTSCFQTENSSTADADTYGSGSVVNSIFAQHCTPCHSYQSMGVAGLVAAGLLVKGDPTNSKVYYRLTGSSGPNGPKNMPQGGAALSSSDLATIESWVQNAP